jgi:hypothetical protein
VFRLGFFKVRLGFRLGGTLVVCFLACGFYKFYMESTRNLWGGVKSSKRARLSVTCLLS